MNDRMQALVGSQGSYQAVGLHAHGQFAIYSEQLITALSRVVFEPRFSSISAQMF